MSFLVVEIKPSTAIHPKHAIAELKVFSGEPRLSKPFLFTAMATFSINFLIRHQYLVKSVALK